MSLYALLVRAWARAHSHATSSPSRWLHQNAWMVLEIEMGTKRQGVYDRTHTNRCQTAGNALTNIVPPFQSWWRDAELYCRKDSYSFRMRLPVANSSAKFIVFHLTRRHFVFLWTLSIAIIETYSGTSFVSIISMDFSIFYLPKLCI